MTHPARRLRHHALLLLAAAAALPPASAWGAQGALPPDVVLVNGKVVTLDARESVAQAVAVRDGRFVAIGTTRDVRRLAGPGTRVVDLAGRTVVPGLIDAHCHPAVTMLFTGAVDGRAPGVPSVAQFLGNLEARVKETPKGEWIVAVGASASQTKFAERRLPTRQEMDAAAPENPVWFWNGTHGEVLNSRGLSALGVSKGQVKLAHGGQVEVDASGEPTGRIFEGEANAPFVPTPQVLLGWFAKGIPALWNSHGFTTVHGMLALPEAEALRHVARSGARPTIRYSHSVFAEPDGAGFPDDLGVLAMPPEVGPDRFKTLGIKLWIDGEVDAGSGFCSAPYADPAGVPGGGRGLQVATQEQATAFAIRARKAGLAASIHASCDASSDIAVRAFRAAAAGPGPRTPQRLEHHGQFVAATPEVARAVKDLGLLVVTQPAWLAFLGGATRHLLGAERADTAWRYGSMVKGGLRPAGSTDTTGAYLQSIDPFLHMAAAVTRRSDVGVLQPGEALSVPDALRMWTLWAARAIGEEASRGSIEKGKLADMTVLTEDLLAIPSARIGEVKAAMVIVGGEVVYRAP